ncbi:MAG TPA: MFS transporter [Dehalococcoidia bacterium]
MTTETHHAVIAGRLAHRLPFFYGWIVVYIGFLGVFMMGATSFWGLAVFIAPMTDDTGWSRASLSLALMLRFIVGAFGGLLLGRFADRRGGPSRLLFFGLLVDAGSIAALHWVDSAWQFILLYGVIGGAGNTGMRVTGGSLIPKWFIQRRGAAVGFSSMGGGLSALIMVPLISVMVSELGWRDAWTGLAAIMFVMVLPCVPLAVRAPEDIGLQPDGIDHASRARANPAYLTERSYTLQEALRMSQFYFLLAAIVFGSYSLQTATITMVPYFEDIGFTKTTAAAAVATYGFFSIVARFVWGFAADRMTVRTALAVQAALTAIGTVLMIEIGAPWSLYGVAAYMGIMLGGFPTLGQLIWPEFFGRFHIGSIVGLTQFFTTILGSAGPLIGNYIRDETGSYATSLWIIVVTWLLCALATYAVRPRREAVEPAPAVSSAG